jgi:hypothetical protein
MYSYQLNDSGTESLSHKEATFVVEALHNNFDHECTYTQSGSRLVVSLEKDPQNSDRYLVFLPDQLTGGDFRRVSLYFKGLLYAMRGYEVFKVRYKEAYDGEEGD